MEKNLALVLLLAPFCGFLFNVFLGKKAGKSVIFNSRRQGVYENRTIRGICLQRTQVEY